MLNPADSGSRRAAMPRRSAMHGRPGEPGSMGSMSGARPSAAPTIGEVSGFIGFAGIQEEDEVDGNDWFLNKEEHLVLGDSYLNVRMFMTARDYGADRRWCETQMHGTLKIVQVKECEGYPAIVL